LNPVWECILSTFFVTVLRKSGWVVTLVLTGIKDCAFASHGGSCVDELCNDCEGVEEGNKRDLESVASFSEACVPYKTDK
jgi:hypothetical protein